MARLLRERDGKTYTKPVRVEEEPSRLKGLLNETRWKILTLLAERPRYPAQIADELGMHEQNVYYHIRELEDSGLIEVAERREQSGAVAKYYRVRDYGFVIELPFGEEQVADFGIRDASEPLQRFLHPLISNGEVQARIVVGSPDPHGPHQVRSRDAHLATEIGLFLGQYGAYRGDRVVLDVDMTAGGDRAEHLVLLGGPLTNMVTSDMNPYLPVKFQKKNFPFRNLVSERTGNEYAEDTNGFLAKIPNPDDPSKSVMVVAGNRLKGTRAAVIALTEYHDEVLEAYDGEEKWAVVVDGKDMDGDGKIDAVDILE